MKKIEFWLAVQCNKRICFSYLKADFIWRLLGVLLDGVRRGHRRRVDGAIVRHNQPVAPVVQLKPKEFAKFKAYCTVQIKYQTETFI